MRRGGPAVPGAQATAQMTWSHAHEELQLELRAAIHAAAGHADVGTGSPGPDRRRAATVSSACARCPTRTPRGPAAVELPGGGGAAPARPPANARRIGGRPAHRALGATWATRARRCAPAWRNCSLQRRIEVHQRGLQSTKRSCNRPTRSWRLQGGAANRSMKNW